MPMRTVSGSMVSFGCGGRTNRVRLGLVGGISGSVAVVGMDSRTARSSRLRSPAGRSLW